MKDAGWHLQGLQILLKNKVHLTPLSFKHLEEQKPVSSLLKNLHVDAQTLQKVILTLHACDMINEEQLSARKIVYTLKGAA